MSFINHVTKEINCKIVYFGAGLSGKTTNIQYIYDKTGSPDRGPMMTPSAENERTLFFDFLPLSVGEVRDYKTRFLLYSVPGQTFYETSSNLILKGVDGVVFVVDSQPERMEANIESYETLEKILNSQGYDINKLPLVVQYNKRDLSDAVPIAELETTFNPMKRPHFEGIANRGVGVMETLQAISKGIIKDLRGGKTS